MFAQLAKVKKILTGKAKQFPRLRPYLANPADTDTPMLTSQSDEVHTPKETVKSQLQSRIFSVEKDGNRPDENEDAYPDNLEDMQGSIRIAIADGATESAFAKLWANLLVKGAVAKEWSAETLDSDVAEVYKAWAKELQKMDLPWHAEVKVQQGDYATLLCLYIHQPTETANNVGRWSALSIGDCCLFHYRGDKLLESFPIIHSHEFGNRPLLINSILEKNVNVWEKRQGKSGEWEDGDEFIIFTDALAAWYLHEVEGEREPLQRIHDLADIERFRQFVIEQRTNGSLRNDDTTMLWLRVYIDSNNHENIPD